MIAGVTPAIGDAPAPEAFRGAPWEAAAAAAVQHAPYLRRLLERRGDLCAAPDRDWAQRLCDGACALADQIAREPVGMYEGMRALRRAKDQVHLACALADLSRAWPLAQITAALTGFADASVRAGLSLAVRELSARGHIIMGDCGSERGPAPGVTLIAMGKMGAHELNYSSDIDFSVFFDAEIMSAAGAREPRVAAVRLVAPLVRALEEITPDGYVFRTDLRLRPDPGSTPVAVSLAAAAHYYQNLGQNWERCAFIKARAVAGDLRSGRDFLDELQPFIWRRHLDFAAIADIKSIKRQILSSRSGGELDEVAFDLKLGRGGIRDIELFAQTQQLILGGRDRRLRCAGTLSALDALCDVGVIEAAEREALSDAYVFFREVEHRAQMLEDAQTHRVPGDADARARLAALCGFASGAEFERALIERRKRVAEIDRRLFSPGESLADPLGSLIFTGVEDDPETLATIAKLGFANPAHVSQTIRGWHHGRIRAMRSERARELLTDLTPGLLRAFAGSGDPDQAFARFDAFFSALVAGVQVLSLLQARPHLLDQLARLLATAPRLALALARRPALLDAMIEQRFARPVGEDAEAGGELLARVAEAAGYEAKLNAARRFQREQAFRIGVQVIEGVLAPSQAAQVYTALAEASLRAMSEAAMAETEARFGPAPGAMCVLALGKFGGRELSEGADLDIMVVYEEAAPSDFYSRFAQRLLSALSAATEEGALYEVDAQLRPSGTKGPVAVRLSSFERYYSEEAWTWEMLALTRARTVAGDPMLCADVSAFVGAVLARPRDRQKTMADVVEMRALIERERPARSTWDLKLSRGGFVDVEFVAQALQLVHAASHPDALAANTGEALQSIADLGLIDLADAATLQQAWRLWSDLQQVLRICAEGEFDAGVAPKALRAKLAAIGGVSDFAELEEKIRTLQRQTRAVFARLIQ